MKTAVNPEGKLVVVTLAEKSPVFAMVLVKVSLVMVTVVVEVMAPALPMDSLKVVAP